MSARTRRQRSSTVASAPPEATRATAELQQLLDHLSATLQTPSSANSYPDLSKVIDQATSVRRHLITSAQPPRANDDFRHLNGFQTLIDTLRAFSGFYHPTKRSQREKTQLFDLLEIILGILTQSFREHYGNRRYFKRRVEGGGWAALGQTIASIGVGGSESDIWGEAQLFGRLLAFALDDKRFEGLCQDISQLHPTIPKQQPNTSLEEVQEPDGSPGKAKEPKEESKEDIKPEGSPGDEEIIALVKNKLSGLLKEAALLPNPGMVPIIIDFWKTIPRSRDTPVNPAALVVILTLSKILSISNHNLLALHTTGILSTLLPLAFDSDTVLDGVERSAVESLCGSLMSLGVNNLEDAQYLLCNKSSTAADFLLQTMKTYNSPAYIQFDLSLHGYASIELPNLGRSFPPTSGGYTFTAWIYVDQFDAGSHTTIFGAFDSTQTCFVLAYLERDTHNFILQTSVTSSRPSVRFKSTVFKEQQWYHIAVVHRRPKTMSASKAALYVNGEFAEQVKCMSLTAYNHDM
jgi:hypothetical protein